MRAALIAVSIAGSLAAQTPASLRGHVSFLASDLLEGRDTPSRGLDIAAGYIASQFRGAPLESPLGPDYCQAADFVQVSDRGASLQFTLTGAGKPPATVAAEHLSLSSYKTARFTNEPVYKWAPGVKIQGSLAGRIVMLREPANPNIIATLALAKPDAIVQLVRKTGKWRTGVLMPVSQISIPRPAILSVPEREVEAIFDRLPTGITNAHATLSAAAPEVKPAHLCNLVGLLPGSDPQHREEYILISAHYDHLGPTYNGANDNASGTATVLELAHALAQTNPHPRRSLVFICFFGEERGLLGSTWYVQHPVFPLARTVTEINFEQLGEPNPSDGLPPGSLGVTGYDFTSLPELLSGLDLRKVPGNDEYFERSDNYPFAQAGVPSHTFAAAFDFPDYHRPSDQWQKLDYDNMAKLVRELAVAIRDLANRSDSPHWNDSTETKGFLSAWNALHH